MIKPAEPTAVQAQPHTPSHSRVAKYLHWGFIAVFIYALTKQLDEVEELEDLALLEFEMVFSGFFLLLLVVRFVFMRATQPSVLPADTPALTKRLAAAVHLAMYATLALIPATGLWIGWMYGSGVKAGSTMDTALLLHEIAVNTCYFLILGHIGAAVYHRYQRDGIWDSMVPVWKEEKAGSD